MAFDVTELRLGLSTGRIKTHNSTISDSNLSVWLGDDGTLDTDGDTWKTVFRLVWVERNNETMQMSLPQQTFSTILDAFELRLANQYYASHFTGVTKIPQISPSKSTAFTFSYHPKLAMLWSVSRESSTNVMVLSTAQQVVAMKALFNTQWEAIVASHAMFPLLLCSLLLSQEIHSAQNSIKVDVREVEVRTGYHRFASRHERPATGDLSELSARMSGCETKLASITRKVKALEELCNFMSINSLELNGQMDVQQDSRHDATDTSLEAHLSGDEVLSQSVELLSQRLRMQTADNDYIMQRVRSQNNAVCLPIPVNLHLLLKSSLTKTSYSTLSPKMTAW